MLQMRWVGRVPMKGEPSPGKHDTTEAVVARANGMQGWVLQQPSGAPGPQGWHLAVRVRAQAGYTAILSTDAGPALRCKPERRVYH